MLKIKTYLDRSTIHGIGLFAGEAIKANQEVWAFHPAVDHAMPLNSWQDMEQSVAAHSFQQIRQLAYKEGDKVYICTDNAQFMNHSSRTQNVGNIKDGNTMVALCDILEGQELLCNYFEFCDHDDWSLPGLQE